MRGLTHKEMNKRGCIYCSDLIKRKLEPDSKLRSLVCKHDKCPYHELDSYDTYTQFLKSPQQNALKMVLEKIMHPKRGNSKNL